MGGYCTICKSFVLLVVSLPGLLKKIDNLNVIVNIIGQINEYLSSEFCDTVGKCNTCNSQ